ncbi:Gp49 family protein [uncultured Dysosmobacter sp.]|uniref:Gp49 family protein n=1 Tax=uncultured Dysosmobacter sp. TaxID=2591384 RepID=UPI00345CA306
MNKYIGTKLVEAEPAKRYEDANEFVIIEDSREDVSTGEGEVMKNATSCAAGYKVRYPDGYESWSPKEVFERAYLLLTSNDHMRTDAPSISQEMVDDFIVATEAITMGDKTTVVRAMLKNGFEIVESSACVSPENYDEKLGQEICMEKIKDKVWHLLGFLLQTAVHGVDGCRLAARAWKPDDEAEKADVGDGPCGFYGAVPPAVDDGPYRMDTPCGFYGSDPANCFGEEQERRTGLTFGQAIEAAKRGAKIARKGWNGKNQHIELASAISYRAPDGTVVNAEHDAIGNRAFAFCGTSGVQMGWLASQADMLAEDWEIVE